MKNGCESLNFAKNSEKLAAKISQVENFDELDYIRLIGESENIEIGECQQLKKNNQVTAYSYGANPCVCGVIQTRDDKFYMFHSIGSVLTIDQEKLLRIAKKGIVGGGIETLQHYSDHFEQANIKTVQPPSPYHDFNIVFVKDKNEFNTAPGLYYCYDETEQF